MRRFFLWLYVQSWAFRIGVLTVLVTLGTFACIAAVAWLTGSVRATMVSIWISPLVVGALLIRAGGKAFRNKLE